ncbi:MAG: ATP-binding cassette domain-containing protein, partial [Planctomycetota bacterium]|nr:ATP-binding cassette domain-containing protein [Planctomycetota bacterium]
MSKQDNKVVFEGVSKVFANKKGEDLTVLEAIDLSVKEGEFVCLLGPSGCGKSTLMNAIAGFVKPTRGELTV